MALLAALCPATAQAQAVAVVDIRIGIADPVQRGSVTVSQNVDFGIVSAPKRDDGLQECRYVADPDRPVMSRSSNSTQLRLADPQGGCQFLTGAPQPGIIELQCDSASTVALQFAITNNSPNNRVQLQFSTRGDEFLTVNGSRLSSFNGQCVDGRVRLVLTPAVNIFVGALPTGGSISLGTIRIDAAFS